MVRRSSTILLLLAPALLWLACTSPRSAPAPVVRPAAPAPEPQSGLNRVIATGELRVGMSGEQPPLNMRDRQGQIFGLEVALARVLASSMGVKARFVQIPFPELLDALERGEVDLVMSGMTITPERNRRVAFVGPYYVSGKSVLTTSGVVAGLDGPDDLDQPDFLFVALAGSTSEVFVRTYLPEANLRTTRSLDEAIDLVLRNEAQGLVADRETVEFAALRHPDEPLYAAPIPNTIEPMGIALRAEDTLFANLLDNYLEALEKSGLLDKARTYWFENPEWLKDLPRAESASESEIEVR